MGKGEGFCGRWVLLCAIFLALCRRLQPIIVYHECTVRFPSGIFDKILCNHEDYHAPMTPRDFGAPVNRARSYDAMAIWMHSWMVSLVNLDFGLHVS